MSTYVRPAAAVPNPADHVLQLTSGFMATAAMQVAVKLNIADQLITGPKSAAELAAATNTNEDALYRTLRLLTTLGVFSEVGLRYFALNPAADVLRSDHPQTVRPLVQWMTNNFHFRVFSEIMHSVRTGKPAGEHAVGMPVFDYFRKDDEVCAEFDAAMTNISAGLVAALLEVYDFSGIKSLTDVAGGHGRNIISILQKYPDMRGVLFDLPEVCEKGQQAVAEAGLTSRCKVVGGDFFKEVPPGSDAYFMQHIIHDWDDERSLIILGNIRRALAGVPNGRVLIMDSVTDQTANPVFASIMDLEMLLMPGGRERNSEEWHNLLGKAGFRITRILPTRALESLIEAVPTENH